MAYTRKTWVSNEIIKATDLNNMESGILENSDNIDSILDILPENVGFKNSVYIGKDISSMTMAEISAVTTDGSFTGLGLGNYRTVNGTTYAIGGFDLLLNTGDTNFTKHNILWIPTKNLYNAQMSNTESGGYESGSENNVVSGGYALSDMRTTNLETAKTTILTDFGEDYVTTYRDIITNSASSTANGWAWYDCQIELMSEIMVYGTKIFANAGYEGGIFKSQFPLFRVMPTMANTRQSYWLRNVAGSTSFACVGSTGVATNYLASNSGGVRPFFFTI